MSPSLEDGSSGSLATVALSSSPPLLTVLFTVHGLLLPPEPPPPPDPPNPPDPPDSPLTQIWVSVLDVSLSSFSQKSWSLLVDLPLTFTISSLPQIVILRPPVPLSSCPLHPSLESHASDTLGLDSRWYTALCSLCCQIHYELISLRFASDFLLICPPFTKLSWSSRKEIEKGLTSLVRWMGEPCNPNSVIWTSVIDFGDILDEVLIISDHFDGVSGLPCIEVIVRHVLILLVATDFVPSISICVYVFVDVKRGAQSLFRAEPPHLGTHCHLFFPKFPLVWSGLDDQASPVLQGSSSRLIVFSTLVVELVTLWVAVDAVSHEAYWMVLSRSPLVWFVKSYLHSIPSLLSFEVLSGTSCLCYLVFPFYVGCISSSFE